VPREFNCFAPVAYTSIKQVMKTLQDRSIALQMRRATKDERPEKLTLRTRDGLIDVRRKLMRWATDLDELPAPDIPKDLFNRIEDRWFILFQIAGVAGGDWPERCRQAAMADFAREEADALDGGPNGDLLGDVWEVFRASGKVQMFTRDILSALLALSESPWETANKGQAVNDWYLRSHLRDFLPDDAEKIAPRKWMEGKVQARGFHELHFKDAFERYLGKGLPSEQQKQTASPAENKAASSGAPSNPSNPSADEDSDVVSKGYGRTHTSDDPSTHPSTHPPAKGATDAVDGSWTDGATPSAHNNHKQDQPINKEKTDGTDGTDNLEGPPRDNAPPREQPPEKQNSGYARPRGAQPRRRRDRSGQ
jgi:hypothetical protein